MESGSAQVCGLAMQPAIVCSGFGPEAVAIRHASRRARARTRVRQCAVFAFRCAVLAAPVAACLLALRRKGLGDVPETPCNSVGVISPKLPAMFLKLLASCASLGSATRLIFHFDDVPPYLLLSLRTLRLQIGPCLRLVEGHCVVHAVPLDDGRILRSRRPLYGNNPSVQGAQ